jgi:polar amino acid transport system substrate-binding protein
MKHKLSRSWKSLSLLLLTVSFILPVIFTQCKKDALPVNGDPEKFTWLTEDYPPFNYAEDGLANGVSVDILVKIFEQLNLSADRKAIRVGNWADSYETVLKTPGTMLFTMVKNAQRTPLFKWVGPIALHADVVITLKNSGVQISQVSDLNNCFTGVMDGYSSIFTLMDLGVQRANIIVYNSLPELYKALENGEVQCIAYSESGHKLVIQALGYAPGFFAALFPIYTSELYYAFNLETTDEMITDFQDQLDKIKADRAADGSSEYEKILNRYNLIQQATDGITEEMVINLVNRTAADLQADAPGTLSKINQKLAPYKDPVNPALYTFVFDLQVVIVADAGNPSLVGVSMAGKPDVTGKLFRDELVAGAKANGTGWVDYTYTKPDQSGLYRKTAYYKLVTASNSVQLAVGAGRYK